MSTSPLLPCKWVHQYHLVVHIHSEILLSYRKECIWVGFNEVNEPRVYYTKWSKSEREKQISYINTYTWNLVLYILMGVCFRSNAPGEEKETRVSFFLLLSSLCFLVPLFPIWSPSSVCYNPLVKMTSNIHRLEVIKTLSHMRLPMG